MWKPQIGPQQIAIEADWCDELFFGGARGGGKSDFLLGDYLQDIHLGHGWRGIMLRKTTIELEELQARACEIFPAFNGVYKVSKSVDFPFSNCWYFPGGATLKMRYLERDSDADGYQGHQYCVGEETLILMADGYPKRIVDIKIGDYVATLEGGKRVIAAVKPYLAPCVKMTGEGINQIHPVWHPVLTDSGWQSYASILGIDSTEFVTTSQEYLPHPSVNLFLKLAVSVPSWGKSPGKSILNQESGKHYLSWCGKLLILSKHIARYILDLLPFLINSKQILGHYLFGVIYGAQSNAQSGLKSVPNCQDNCLFDFHRDGEQLLFRSDSDPISFPSPNDAEEHSRVSYKLDVLGNIPLHSRRSECGYLHPYALSEVKTEWESSSVACEMSFVGNRMVADITVEGANHYISYEQGTINKNTWIGFDELTNHPTPYGYNKLKACLRSALGIRGRIRAGGNPGGKGHIWVKARFIDCAPPYSPFDDPVTGLTRMFIPSKITDNKYLKDNKQYISLLKSSGSVELVKAWLNGDWNVVAGAFFDCWQGDKHVLVPFTIPKDWQRFRSFDWGSARPFSVGWWAIADGSNDLPRGALIRYREWYGASEPNVGLKMTAEQVAEGIKRRDFEDKFAYSVADPSCWKVDGGPSIAERMLKVGVLWRRADNERINGWDQMRQRFVGMDDAPMIYCFNTCIDSIRTVPLLQHDENKPEDIDTDMEDHAADDWRYACMSRPWQRPMENAEMARFPQHRTIDEMIARQTRRRKQGE